jgi:hypothetical protein
MPDKGRAMQAHIGLGHILTVDIGLHYGWFIIALLVMFWLSSVAGIKKEAVDPKTELLQDIKGKTCAAGVPGASVMRCLGFYSPLPQRV